MLAKMESSAVFVLSCLHCLYICEGAVMCLLHGCETFSFLSFCLFLPFFFFACGWSSFCLLSSLSLHAAVSKRHGDWLWSALGFQSLPSGTGRNRLVRKATIQFSALRQRSLIWKKSAQRKTHLPWLWWAPWRRLVASGWLWPCRTALFIPWSPSPWQH